MVYSPGQEVHGMGARCAAELDRMRLAGCVRGGTEGESSTGTPSLKFEFCLPKGVLRVDATLAR